MFSVSQDNDKTFIQNHQIAYLVKDTVHKIYDIDYPTVPDPELEIRGARSSRP